MPCFGKVWYLGADVPPAPSNMLMEERVTKGAALPLVQKKGLGYFCLKPLHSKQQSQQQHKLHAPPPTKGTVS